jgi:hypothetical protein
MIVKYARNVFIDSEINSGSYNGRVSKINFPSTFFSVKDKERMRMTLTSFEMRRNFYPINPTNNTFFWYDPTLPVGSRYAPIVVDVGNYDSFAPTNPAGATPPQSLGDAIIIAIRAVPALATSTIAYSQYTRKYTITLPVGLPANAGFVSFQVKGDNNLQPAQVSDGAYFNDFHEIIGGYPTRDNWGGVPIDLFTGAPVGGAVPATVSSPFVASLNTLEAIYIRTNLHSGNFQTYGFEKDLPNQQGLTPTQIFARIPLSRAYFDPVHEFINFEDTNNLFTMDIDQTQLSQVFFTITDDKGRLIEEIATGQSRVGNLSFKLSFRWEVVEDDHPPDTLRLTLDKLLSKYPNLTLN